MRIDVFTIFPEYLEGPADRAPARQGPRRGLLDVRSHDLRDWTRRRHRTVDDAPFGGGAGMVLTPEPIFAAVEAVDPPRPLLPAVGRRPSLRPGAWRGSWPAGAGFSLLCGRYEGVDQRVADHLCDGELSVGDYVLAGGEVAAWWWSRRWPGWCPA